MTPTEARLIEAVRADMSLMAELSLRLEQQYGDTLLKDDTNQRVLANAALIKSVQ